MKPLLLAACAALCVSAAHAGSAPDSTVRVVPEGKNLMSEALRHAGQPQQRLDPFTGFRGTWVALPHGLPHHSGASAFLTAYDDSTGGSASLLVTDMHHGWQWMDAHHGYALADSSRLDLDEGRWDGSVLGAGLVTESVSYPLALPALRTLTEAARIQLRIGYETFALDPRDAWAWRAFLAAVTHD